MDFSYNTIQTGFPMYMGGLYRCIYLLHKDHFYDTLWVPHPATLLIYLYDTFRHHCQTVPCSKTYHFLMHLCMTQQLLYAWVEGGNHDRIKSRVTDLPLRLCRFPGNRAKLRSKQSIIPLWQCTKDKETSLKVRPTAGSKQLIKGLVEAVTCLSSEALFLLCSIT